MLLASLADTKAFLEVSGVNYDSLLTMLLTQVSKRVETFLNREMESKQRIVYYNAGRKKIFLPAYPINLASALSVSYIGTAMVKDTDYFVWDEMGVIEFLNLPSYNVPRELCITWTGGYADSAAIPADVQMATIMQVSFVFRRRKDIGLGSISMPDGSISVSAPTELLPEVKSILKSYRKAPGA